jgi:hypothetical protein
MRIVEFVIRAVKRTPPGAEASAGLPPTNIGVEDYALLTPNASLEVNFLGGLCVFARDYTGSK